jgi:anti-sigma factor RsiW
MKPHSKSPQIRQYDSCKQVPVVRSEGGGRDNFFDFNPRTGQIRLKSHKYENVLWFSGIILRVSRFRRWEIEWLMQRARNILEMWWSGPRSNFLRSELFISTQDSVRTNSLAYKAPPELETKIRAALQKQSKSAFQRISRFQRPLIYAAFGLSMCVLGVWMSDPSSKDRTLTEQAISNHARSLFVGHLLDVASSDQDSLKTWFTGKLDFSPPVPNLTKGGYKLAGVRLDILENRRVAAIVYKHQDCFVNAFIWPIADHAIYFDTQLLSGFNLCGWNRSGLNYLIVSELSQSDMENFEDQFRQRTE